MQRPLLALVLLAAAFPARAQDRPAPAPRPERPPIEAQCRSEVEQRHPPGTLSRNRGERERLVQLCVANGGRLP